MDEQYIKDLYDQLGGEDRFGKFEDFQTLITTDAGYQKDFHQQIGEDVLGNFDDFVTLVKKKSTPLSFQGQVDMFQPSLETAPSGAQQPETISQDLAIEQPKKPVLPFPLVTPTEEDFKLGGEIDMLNSDAVKPKTVTSLRERYMKAVEDGADEETQNQYFRDWRSAVDDKNAFKNKLAEQPVPVPPKIKDGQFGIHPIRKQDQDEAARRVLVRFQEEITGKRENQGVVGEITEDAKQILPSFNRALISTLTSIPKSVSILAKGIDDLLGTRSEPIENYSMYQLGSWIDKKAEEIGMTALDEKRLGFFNSTLPQAFGSMMGMVLTGGRQATASPFVQQSVARQSLNLLTSPVAITGALQASVPEYEAAKRAGASDSEAFLVFLKNIPGGMTEALPIANMFTRLNKVTNSGLLNVLKEGTAQGLEEASQEAVQQYLTNKIAQGTYDPKRDLKDGILEGSSAGFIVGFIMPGAMNAMANMTTEDRMATKQMLANAIKVSTTAPQVYKRKPSDLEINTDKANQQLLKPNEKATEPTRKDVGTPSENPVQEPGVQVQAETQNQVVDDPQGEGVAQEVREPVQQLEEEQQPAVEEGLQRSEDAVVSSEEGERLSNFKKGDVVKRRLNDKIEKTYEIIKDKGGVWKLRDLETGNISDWNADNNDGFSKVETTETAQSVDSDIEPGGVKFEALRDELENATGMEYSDEAVQEHVDAAGGWGVVSDEEQNIEETIPLKDVKAKVKSKQLRPLKDLESELDNLKSKREQWLKQKKDKYDPDAFAELEKQISDWEKAVSDSKKEKTTKEEVEYEQPTIKPNKGDQLIDSKNGKVATVTRIFKPAKGSALENEPYLVDVKYDDGKKAINMPLSKFQKSQPTIKQISDASDGKVIIAKPSHGAEPKKYFIDLYTDKKGRHKKEVDGKPVKKYPKLGLFSHVNENKEYVISEEIGGFQIVKGKNKKDAEQKLDELVKRFGGEQAFKAEMDARLESERKLKNQPETFGKGYKVIGVNSEGYKVGVNDDGARAVLKGNIVLSQPISIIPGAGYSIPTPTDQFLTEQEAIDQANQKAKDNGFKDATHLINSVNKRTGEKYERVQDIPNSVIEDVRNNRDIENLTPEENDNKTRSVSNEGSTRPSGVDTSMDAGNQTGGVEQGVGEGSQTPNADLGGLSGEQERNLSGARNESAGSNIGSDEGRVQLEPGLKDADVQHNFIYPQGWERTKNKSFSKRQAYNDNIAALEVVNKLLDDPDMFATDEQKAILSRYNGLGPLVEVLFSDDKLAPEWKKSNIEFYDDAQRIKSLLNEIGNKTDKDTKPVDTAKSSTRNAYYTSLPIIRAIYNGIVAGGFNGGNVLEGSVGSGRFIGGMPEHVQANSRIKGVDMDVVSSLVSKYLYPKASIVNSPLQQASIPSNYYDLFVSNIPFGNAPVYDAQMDKRGGPWKESQKKLHTYFFAKAIDSVRPGGYVAIVTTANVLDTPSNQFIRDLIETETDFMGAVRLSEEAFNADAGTQVVTDVILLRKKLVAQKPTQSQISNIAKQIVPNDNSSLPDQEIQYNEYFKKNPENIFGTEFRAGGLYSSERGYTIKGAVEPEKVAAKLAEIAKRYPILERQAQERDTLETLQINGDLGRTVSGGIVKTNGKYFRVVDFDRNSGKYNVEEVSPTVLPSKTDMPILDAFIDLKNQYFNILAKDSQGQDAVSERKQIKKSLDNFVELIKPSKLATLANGKKAVNRLLVNDPDFFAITALQNSDGTYADVIQKPVAKERTTFEKTDNPQEAIGYSINTYGKISLPFIQKVTGAKTEQDAINKIKDFVFETPDGEVIERPEYLSGNVVEKLKQARNWVKVDSKYKKNVAELEKVIPAPIPKEQITFQLGASWIPLGYTQKFLDTIFGAGAVTVRYNKTTDDYEVNSRVLGGEYEAIDDEGNKRDVATVVKAAITKNVPELYKTVMDEKIPLPKLTQIVRDKAERLQNEFAGLIEADQTMGDELSKLYNEFFNGVVIKQYDGSTLTFPGMQGYPLNPHQKDAIMLMIQKMGGMIDHIVGAGKTLVMTVGGIKMKEMGLVNKPMIATMKSVVPGMLEQIKAQYPEKKILAPKDSDFSANNRQRLLAQIANNDWDLIIISHENLGTIPLPPEFERQYINDEIDNLLNAYDELKSEKNDTWGAKQIKALQEQIAKLRTRLEKLQSKDDSTSKTDLGIMGVDFLMIDESQQFKNLDFVTKLRNVAGLGTQKGSNRAKHLKMVTRYLQNMHGGDKGVVFASGTPISNSLVEVYNIFQYLRPSLLKKLEMVSLDQFLKNFALITTMMEKNVAGVIKNKTRLNKFVNVPELASLYAEISDIRGVHNLKLERPDIKGGKPDIVLIPQSESVKQITTAIYNASSTGDVGALNEIGIETKGDSKKALGLILTTLGTKASIDPRLVFPKQKADGGKLFKVADEVKAIYDQEADNKGVQLIFADLGTPKNKNASLGERVKDQVIEMYGEDILEEISGSAQIWKLKEPSEIRIKLAEVLEISDEEASLIVEEASNLSSFNVYEELKRLLMQKGIKSDEIAFIHDAPTKNKKEELFKKVNDGDVRVLIGSTQKMGTGVNVQKRVAAMHHVDVGWRPSDLEQRNGRGIRRGNMYKEVAIKYYGTEETIDAYRFDLLARKQSGIDSFRAGAKGLREMDFEDGESMTMAEFSAAISGDKRMLELEKLKAKFEKLRNRIESTKRANALREVRIAEAKRFVEYVRNVREIVNKLAGQINENIKLQELEEEEKDEKGKVKKTKKVEAVFIGEVDGQSYDTKVPSQREAFYKAIAEQANYAMNRSYREQIGVIGGIPVFAKPSNTAPRTLRIDLGEETVANEWSPIEIIKQTVSVTPVTIKTAIRATVRDINIDVTKAEENYKQSLGQLKSVQSVPEAVAKQEDIKEFEAIKSKKDKLETELKSEIEKNQNKNNEDSEYQGPELPESVKESEKPVESPENIKTGLDNIVAEESKKNADENFEKFSGAMAVGLPISPIGKVRKKPSDNSLLAAVVQGKMSAQQAAVELEQALKIGDEEVDTRIEEAAKPAAKNIEQTWGHALSQFFNSWTNHFKHLPENRFPREANILREFETLYPWAKSSAAQYVKSLVDGMTPNQYKVFSMRIILADMLESIKKGENMIGPDGKLPFGFKDDSQVERQLTKYDLLMKADPRIQRAFDARQQYMNELKDELMAAGLMEDTDIQSYYHRRVLQYKNDITNAEILFGKDIADKKRDFQRRRKGTRGLDYSTNFLETEWKVVSEARFEIEKQKILKDLMAPYEAELKDISDAFEKDFEVKLAEIGKQYGEDSVEYKRYKKGKKGLKMAYLEEHMPEGYVFYRVSDENTLFWAKTVTQKAIDRSIERAEEMDNTGVGEAMDVVEQLVNSLGRGLMVGPKRKQYMIPKELGEQLTEMAKNEKIDPVENLASKVMSTWKQLMILSPTRVLRYNINNFGSDLDRLIQVDPTIAKYAPEAAKELWNYLTKGESSPQLMEAMRGDVVNSGFQLSELADVSEQSWAKSVMSKDMSLMELIGKRKLKEILGKTADAPMNLWERYLKAVTPYVQYRENILRYAAYKAASAKTAKGDTFFWASRPASIRAIADQRQRNAKLAREVFGDYMNLSQFAMKARRVAVPFYSWFEVNMTTHLQLLKNASSYSTQKQLAKKAVFKGVPFVVFRMARAYVSLALFTAALESWNLFASAIYGGDDDTDRKLREARVKGANLIVGVNKDGTIEVLPIQGAFYDFLDWFGLWTIRDDVDRIFENEDKLAAIQKMLSDQGENALKKGYFMLSPLVKIFTEQATKQYTYPSNTPITDNYEYWAKQLTLGDEYNYFLTDKPQKQTYLERKLSNSFLREFDTEQLAYYEAKRLIDKYHGKAESSGQSENPTVAKQAKAKSNYMKALRYGKVQEADKWLTKYVEAGGTLKAINDEIKRMDIFSGVKKTAVNGEPRSEFSDLKQLLADKNYKAETHFGRQLTTEDRFLIKQAMNYYERIKDTKKKVSEYREENQRLKMMQ